jgi:Protein of unknown function DUF45
MTRRAHTGNERAPGTERDKDRRRCGRGVNVHWRTFLLPPRYIDYILAHELVHLCEPRYNKRF